MTYCYRFNNLCCFQYFWMDQDKEGRHKSPYNKVYFGDKGLTKSSWLDVEKVSNKPQDTMLNKI